MKVLGIGPGPEFFSVEAVCDGSARTNKNQIGGCGSKLLVELEDMLFHSVSAGHGRTDRWVAYICGNCGTLNKLRDDQCPPDPELLKLCEHTVREREANNRIDPY